MLLAKRKGMFSVDFLMLHDDEEVALLDMGVWKESAEISWDGHDYSFTREKLISGPFQLKLGEKVLVEAVKPSIWRNRFELRIDEVQYRLESASLWRREFVLYMFETEIGRIKSKGFFKQTISINLPENWPDIVKIFCFWLAQIIWQRQEQASS